MDEKQKQSLPFHLDPKSGVPFYKQIILQVELAIADGRLTSNDQLPTVRSLAVDLKINPNTVARAYNEMEIRGIVNTQQGTGTFISDKKFQLSDIEREQFLEGLVQPFASKALAYGFSLSEVCHALGQYMSDREA
ncbi:MAG: GntR family transcriptional regulator [Spirochaetes bacterium GWD1_61_31]|nr:MAG: GntR family transcriptional regulator [Spirochaetes bacterium GWB1_60_80]OHD31912.1 MAG: GntR family transcriptional regulator [Spirochaetes bacterium GWC1_61_12]OHD39991.1 MAG: GntR family transcriptional regulator [Spirochaetes bacterium GWD1_61_31]OHD42355.1 MAG: GntR family transcriptional regulator [Spirochaetes bacterium GWE1_60_18]OHD60527.1 MAG: GntR family transcriptional regulator [Spirochaetes bacterium GWF1_60_12]HAW86965.1 GntR family transcriptional regulator [Spirochaeta